MKINLIGMILNSCDARAFVGAIVDDDGRALNAADSLHAMILEYARVWNGHDSGFVALHHSNANPTGGACTTCGSDCNERDELIKAERAIEQLSKDAARYRWLRSRIPGGTYRIMGVIYSEGGAGVDAAIDAAMTAAPAVGAA